MSALTLMVLVMPPLWMASVWAINRFAVRNLLLRTIRAVFGLSAASPLLALVLWVAIEGMGRGDPLGGFSDPKVLLILLQIGVPASLVTTLLAYWGCRGRVAEQ